MTSQHRFNPDAMPAPLFVDVTTWASSLDEASETRERALFSVEVEACTDYELTAQLASDAFGSGIVFRAERLQWLYERSFGLGTIVIALRHDGAKVGHVGVLKQAVRVGGKAEVAGQIVDLFVAKAFRSKERVAEIYGEVERCILRDGIRFALAMPNPRALSVNQRFLKLTTFCELPVRAGLALPVGGRHVTSRPFDAGDASLGTLFDLYRTASGDNGLVWTGARLFERLCDPTRRYGVHASANLLLISSPRTTRRLDHTLLCGFLRKPQARATPAEVRALVRSACALWRRPLYVYAGLNTWLPQLPGFELPRRLRPSNMILQSRDFGPPGPPLSFDRFELIDFDMA